MSFANNNQLIFGAKNKLVGHLNVVISNEHWTRLPVCDPINQAMHHLQLKRSTMAFLSRFFFVRGLFYNHDEQRIVNSAPLIHQTRLLSNEELHRFMNCHIEEWHKTGETSPSNATLPLEVVAAAHHVLKWKKFSKQIINFQCHQNKKKNNHVQHLQINKKKTDVHPHPDRDRFDLLDSSYLSRLGQPKIAKHETKALQSSYLRVMDYNDNSLNPSSLNYNAVDSSLLSKASKLGLRSCEHAKEGINYEDYDTQHDSDDLISDPNHNCSGHPSSISIIKNNNMTNKMVIADVEAKSLGLLDIKKKRRCWQHPSIPLCKVGTAVVFSNKNNAFINASSTDRSTGIVCVVRQITKDATDCSKFVCTMVSPVGIKPRSITTMPEWKFLEELRNGKCWATKFPASKASSLTSDIHANPSDKQIDAKWSPQVLCHCQTTQERNTIISTFNQRHHDPEFKNQQHKMILGIEDINTDHFNTTIKLLSKGMSPRQHQEFKSAFSKKFRCSWDGNLPLSTSSPNYAFCLTMCLLFTSNLNDEQAALVANQLFKSQSIKGDTYDDPHSFGSDPKGATKIIAANSKQDLLLINRTNDMGNNDQRGVNNCWSVSKKCVFFSKQVLVHSCCNNESLPVDAFNQESWFKIGSLEAVPDFMLLSVERDKDLLPSTFDHQHFARMHGVGPKVLSLVAQCVYGASEQPAVDRHSRRFTIDFGTGNALLASNNQMFTQNMMKCYCKQDYHRVNTVPGTTAQFLNNKEFRKSGTNVSCVESLMKLAVSLACEESMKAFLSHYPQQGGH